MEADFEDTVRERVVKALTAKLQAMNRGSGNYLKWDKVVRSPLAGLEVETTFNRAVGIYDSSETYQYHVQCTECTLRVEIEYWYKMASGQNASTEAERIRGDLVRTLTREQAVKEAGTGATLTLSVRLASSDKDVQGPRADTIGGFVELTVVYRHRTHDPYKLLSEV